MPGRDGDPEGKGSDLFAEAFPHDDPPRQFGRRVKALGKRRKRYVGWRRSRHGLLALIVLAGGLGLALVLGVVALLLPGDGLAPRLILGVVALLAAGVGVLGAGGLWLVQQRQRATTQVRLDFHNRGAVYVGPEQLHVFTWNSVGRVIFAPDTTPGETSELILSLSAEEPELRHGRALEVEILRNALVLTSDHYPMTELYDIARHLHKILGQTKVAARPRDGRLYRLD